MSAGKRAVVLSVLAIGALSWWYVHEPRQVAPQMELRRAEPHKDSQAMGDSRSHANASSSYRKAEDNPSEDAQFEWTDTVTTNVKLVRLAAEARLASLISDPERFPELARCRAANRECDAELSEALGKALAWPLSVEFARDHLGITTLISRHDRDQLVSAARLDTVNTLRTNEDSVARLTSLAVLERLQLERQRPVDDFPDDVFDGLSSRTAPEASSLLRFLRNRPRRNPALAEHIVPLADPGRNPRLAASALVTLGAMGASDALQSSIERWREEKGFTPDLAQRAVGPALAECGLPCISTVSSLAGNQDSVQRLSALYAITFVKDADTKASFMQAARARLPAELTGLERDQLAYLSRE